MNDWLYLSNLGIDYRSEHTLWFVLCFVTVVVEVNVFYSVKFSLKMIDYISFAYAASVATGGVIGYVKAGEIIFSN